MRNSDMAFKFNVTDKRISEWLKLLGLEKKRVFMGRKPIGQKERPNNEPRQIKWLSSEYSNVTREQHIDRILSMNI